MKKNILILLSLVFVVSVNAQSSEKSMEDKRGQNEVFVEDADAVPYIKPEVDPEFPGGSSALPKWISKHIEYPAIARENNLQGTVIVKFIVEKDGSISNCQIVSSVHELLSWEAIRVIKKMPNWEPAKQSGKRVRSYFTLPVDFKL